MFNGALQPTKQSQAVTSIISNSTPNYINITDELVDLLLDHARHCDSAAHEVAKKFKELGIEA